MGTVRIHWQTVGKLAAAAAVALLGLQLLPGLLRAPEPPPLEADVGLPRVAAEPRREVESGPARPLEPAARRSRGVLDARGKSGRLPRRREERESNRTASPSSDPTHGAAAPKSGPAPASPPPPTPPPPPVPPIAPPPAPEPPPPPSSPPAAEPPPPAGDGSEEFAPR